MSSQSISPPRTYDQALALLSALQSNHAITSLFTSSSSSSGPKQDLNSLAIPEMLHWLNRAGYTPSDLSPLKTIHISGTKGKGSVSALTASILGQYPAVAGRVGMYTSPHVVTVRERIQLDGKPISQELFAQYFFELWDRFSQSAAKAGDEDPQGVRTKPFYFRYLTILAWHVFLREGVKSVVLECGIGGEFDATNVVPAEAVTAAVVTQLGIDHVAMLGDKVEKIAWHKAGIFKPNIKAFTRLVEGEEGRGVMAVLRDRALEKGTTLVEVSDSLVESWQGVRDAKLQGPFQKYNMALAVAAAWEHLTRLDTYYTVEQGPAYALNGDFWSLSYGLNGMPGKFMEGLRTASLPGRCELFWDPENQIEWFLDGAHTDDSLAGVGQWFAGKAAGDDVLRILVFNQQERDASHLLRVLLEATAANMAHSMPFHVAYFSRNEQESTAMGEDVRDLSVQTENCKVAEAIYPDMVCQTTDSVYSAVGKIKDLDEKIKKGRRSKVLVTGSFHLVGAVLRNLHGVDQSHPER